jgi:hypothetical protein
VADSIRGQQGASIWHSEGVQALRSKLLKIRHNRLLLGIMKYGTKEHGEEYYRSGGGGGSSLIPPHKVTSDNDAALTSH